MRTIDVVAGILLLIGGINWGLIGLFDFNVVTFIFGASVLTKLTYILVGASALWGLYRCKLGHCCHHE